MKIQSGNQRGHRFSDPHKRRTPIYEIYRGRFIDMEDGIWTA
jgi:hypothetical protein